MGSETLQDIKPFSLEWALNLVAHRAESSEQKHAKRYGTAVDPHVIKAVGMVREHLLKLRGGV